MAADHRALRRGVWSTLLILLFASSSAAASRPRHVLLLHSFDREFPPYNVIEDTFRTELSRQAAEPIDFVEISLQPVRFNDTRPDERVLEYLLAAFTDHPPDLMVPIGGPAALFAQQYRQRLFPQTPMLLAGMDERFVHPDTLTPHDTVVTVVNDGPLIVENILRVLPRTTTVLVVIGTSQLEQLWREELRGQLQRFTDRLRFVWSNELAFADVLKQSALLPPNSAIFYVLLSRDIQGIPLTEERMLAQLHAVANAPIFGALSTQLGRGIVGGPLLDIDQVGRTASAVALRMLQGEVASRIKTAPQRSGSPQFDWRKLRRWDITEYQLPPGSVVQFREPTAWKRHQWLIVSVLVGFAEALLLVTFQVNRAKRRRAERSLRESERRFRLLANAAPIMLWMADSDHRCTHVNRAYLEFTGRTLEAEQGHGWTDAIHPDDVKNSLETCVRAFNRRDPIEMEYRLRRHDGEYRWVFITGVPRFTEDGSFIGYIGSSIDITEHKLAKEALSGLSRRLMEAHEGERAVIARDLHDDVGQRLVGLTMQLHSVSHMLSNEASDARLRIRDVCGQAADLVSDIQAISHQLHSSSLEHLGLASAAADLCRELSHQHDVEIGFWKEGIPDDLPKEVALNLFRVLQEALNNALKHSGARDIWVTLRGESDVIQLEVVDNGIGFDPESAMRNQGLGLISMQERLGLVDGHIRFDSQPGTGSRVHARVPLQRTGLASAVIASPPGSSF